MQHFKTSDWTWFPVLTRSFLCSIWGLRSLKSWISPLADITTSTKHTGNRNLQNTTSLDIIKVITTARSLLTYVYRTDEPWRTLVFVRFVLGEILEQVFRHGERTASYDFPDRINTDRRRRVKRRKHKHIQSKILFGKGNNNATLIV